MVTLGVDPGLDGALCFMNSAEAVCSIIDMPTLSLSRGGRNRREINAQELLAALAAPIGHAFVEQAWSRPKDGATQAWKSGEGYGILRGILVARGVPMTFVPPQAWKKDLRLGKGKDAARARASELIGHASYYWPLVKHDGRAESALIALWGIRSLNGIARGEAA